MKKKLYGILICFIFMLGITGCNTEAIIKDTAELNEVEGVSMTIQKGTLKRTSATIVITDLSGKKNTYGEEYRIDKKENGNWKKLDVIIEGEYGWTSIGYLVGANNKLVMEINWKWLYGKLEDGEYRLVKNIYMSEENKSYYFSVEFELKEAKK